MAKKNLLLIIFIAFALPSFAATAIRNVRLFDGNKVINDATVVFDNGVITAAGPNAKIPDGATVIDGKGKTLLPGLIDAHTHAFGNSLERALRFGVTTELDMFTSVEMLKKWKAEQAAGNVAARADIFSAGTLVTAPGGHGTEYFPIPTFGAKDDPQAFIDARIAEGSDYIKLVYDDGSSYGVHFDSLTKDQLQSLIAAAHKRGKLAVVHIGSQPGARAAIEAGADAIVHLFGESKPEAGFGKFVAAHHAFVIPTLSVIESSAAIPSGASLTEDPKLKPYLTADEARQLRASFQKRPTSTQDVHNAFAAVVQLRAAGVPILAGTDAPNPGTSHGASMHRELELLVDAGLTPVQALTAASSTPATTFKLKDRGRIAPGLRADLLLVGGDPTTDIKATRDIVMVWKGGVALDRQPEAPQKAAAAEHPVVPTNGLISDFESGKASSTFGSGWMPSDDSLFGGKSKASFEVVDGGANGTAKSLLVHGDIKTGYPFPWAGAMFFAGSTPMKPVDLSSAKGITFLAKGDLDLKLMVFAASLGQIPAQKAAHAGADWSEVTLLWSDVGIDAKDFIAILVSGGQAAGPKDFQIDEVKLK
jgi:imidazolonepropionase-like amidohydrolase